jgi:hypothetical protein
MEQFKSSSIIGQLHQSSNFIRIAVAKDIEASQSLKADGIAEQAATLPFLDIGKSKLKVFNLLYLLDMLRSI